jgi:hydroxyacid-oxoacid transhydrogenase
MPLETAFSMDTSSIKYGPGVTREVGWDMEEQGTKRVMVVTDPNLADKEPVALTLEALRKHGIDAVLFGEASVEPTDISFQEAIRFAEDGNFDGFVAVGYGPDDVDKLVEGTLPQHRVTKLSPRPVSAEDLKQLFLDSLTLW